MDKNTENKYGHLLDKYLDETILSWEMKQQREEEAKSRYGHFLDYAKPDYTIYEDMEKCVGMCERIRQQRQEDYEQVNRRRQERIEKEKREEQEHMDRTRAFVESILAKKEAERKAAIEVKEKEEKEVEERQKLLNSIQFLVNMHEEVSEITVRTKAMLEYEKKKSEEHEKRMEWFRKQENSKIK